MKYYQGKYKLKNPEKYEGDPTNIIYRSSWELRFMLWCDRNPSIIKFSSEETIVPYISPLDGKYHRYFVDFKIKTIKGEVYLVEIKPKSQTLPPQGTKKTKRFLAESATYLTNQAKWEAARRFAADRKWNFIVLTENELGIT